MNQYICQNLWIQKPVKLQMPSKTIRLIVLNAAIFLPLVVVKYKGDSVPNHRGKFGTLPLQVDYTAQGEKHLPVKMPPAVDIEWKSSIF